MDPTGSTGTAAAVVVATDDQDDVPLDLERWTALATKVLVAEGIADTEMSLTFVDEDTIAGLKQAHLDGDGSPTDVLSFPIDAPIESGDELHIEGIPRMLGDVIICPIVAERQAPDHAGSLDDELALLLVHGLLHLLGHDHAEDDQRELMQARERELLDSLYGPLQRDPWQEA